MCNKVSQCGYSLLEMVVVVAIIGILATTAVPSFNDWMSDEDMSSSANQLIGALSLARIEAIKRNQRVAARPTSGSDWAEGITIWVDDNRDTVIDGTEFVIRRLEPLSDGTDVSTTATSVSYLPTGFISAIISFDICDDRTGETGRTIDLILSGRARVSDKNDCS